MSFETKDARHKEQHGRPSLNMFEEFNMDTSKTRRSAIPHGPFQREKQQMPPQKISQNQREGREPTNRINQQQH